MAHVLLARASGIEGFERYVVIKQIHVERARDDSVVKMFLDEARLAASLHHTNIVQVHDIGQEDGEYYFAMEYVHGEDLRTLLSKLNDTDTHLPLEHVVTIISSVAAALDYAHEQVGPDRKPLHLVHRDVSPANVIVGYDGNVKVVDFGIAKAAHRSTETHSGTLKGKISYMAPEQCLGEAVDRRSDVFSLGVVLYELYTVRRLFKASSDYLTMTAIVSGKVPPPSRHRPDIPAGLEAIMLKALARDPADRYQTADEMRIALDRFATAKGLRTSITALADYMRSTFGRRPEPWLVDEEYDEVITTVDFDGPPESDESSLDRVIDGLPTPKPGSLLDHARRKATAVSSVTTRKSRLKSAVGEDGGDEDGPTTASGTPMAWVPQAPLPVHRSRRRWPFVAAVVGVLAIGGGVAVVATGSSGNAIEPASPRSVTPTPEPAATAPAAAEPVATEPAATEPTTAEPAAAEPAAAEPTEATTPVTTPTPVESTAATPARAETDVATRRPRAKPGRHIKRHATRPATKPATKKKNDKYDPNSLFLEDP